MTMAYNQRTLAEPVHFKGVGVHSGKEVNLTLKPAPPNSGINFRRVDLPAKPQIKAHFNRVVDTSLATVIGENGCIVSTIEHLMACLAGLSIDNVVAELDDYEMPIMDGSATLFTHSIRKSGIVEQNAPRIYFAVNSPIKLEKNGKSVCLHPADRMRISCTIEFDHPVIKTQTFSIDLTEDSFEREICRARTFGFLHELELMKFYGLAKGGSLDNAVVLDQNGIVNQNGLRYADEFVRHKILDCIGDFSLLGLPILGHVELFKSGHHFNHEFLKEFFNQKSSWETMTLADFERSRNVASRL
ncbi:MAG: UDP-3-O-acyl-N-acetylglucosamine deacetylase [Desulfobacterales bacterium]|nr:UDP-3-O-acyl-N-acetylglucosamine deacetylase [Desulfobacterales bacterium]